MSDKLDQIYTELMRQGRDLSAVQATVVDIKIDLLGNGQPGRVKELEDAVQAIEKNNSFRNGVLYSINAIFAFVISFLVAYGAAIWHHFFPGSSAVQR